MQLNLGALAPHVDAALADLEAREALDRLLNLDHTLFQDDPEECANRMGWLHRVANTEDLEAFAADAAANGFTHVVLMGMGGSSLFPELLARTFAVREGMLTIHVIDTTHPAAIKRIADAVPLACTIFVASSKSGGTVETASHLAYFRSLVHLSTQFVAVTDPESPFAELATNAEFRQVWLNDPDIGGRYSALSYFGLVPGSLMGVDLTGLLASADDADLDEAVHLGAVMGAAALNGRDKMTFVIPPSIAAFGDWVEQLIAESTGKHGKGIVPVVSETLGDVDSYGDDRLFVSLGYCAEFRALAEAGHPCVTFNLDDPDDIGALVMTFEVATAMAGAVMGINPFDQPNVAEAKAATKEVLAGTSAAVPASPSIAELLATIKPGDYVALQGFIDPGTEDACEFAGLRIAIRDRYRVATTVGFGPRFLHSTGQLHKGGAPSGVFIQLVDDTCTDPAIDLAIPNQPFTFGTLINAQADGDLITLAHHGLRFARTTLDELKAALA